MYCTELVIFFCILADTSGQGSKTKFCLAMYLVFVAVLDFFFLQHARLVRVPGMNLYTIGAKRESTIQCV